MKTRSLLAAAAAAAVLPYSVNAADRATVHVLKPLAGVTLDAGSKKVSSFYASTGSACRLTLVVGDAVDADGRPAAVAPLRLDVPIQGGNTRRISVSEGEVVEAACGLNTHVLTIRPATTVATLSR